MNSYGSTLALGFHTFGIPECICLHLNLSIDQLHVAKYGVQQWTLARSHTAHNGHERPGTDGNVDVGQEWFHLQRGWLWWWWRGFAWICLFLFGMFFVLFVRWFWLFSIVLLLDRRGPSKITSIKHYAMGTVRRVLDVVGQFTGTEKAV